jgi:hypothetical protein
MRENTRFAPCFDYLDVKRSTLELAPEDGLRRRCREATRSTGLIVRQWSFTNMVHAGYLERMHP